MSWAVLGQTNVDQSYNV